MGALMTKEYSVRTSIAECELNNVEALQGEIERLKAYAQETALALHRQGAEIERLQAEIRALDQANGQAVRENERLTHERDLYRGRCEALAALHYGPASEPGALPPLPPVYGTFTARDPNDVTQELWTRTGYWVEQRAALKSPEQLYRLTPLCKCLYKPNGDFVGFGDCPIHSEDYPVG